MMVHIEDQLVASLEERARIVRRHIVDSIYRAGSGHPGGSLSAADVITALYFHQMKHDPSKPEWAERDYFILSKGHAAPALYAALAETGYFPVEDLKGLRTFESHLQGHPDMLKTPGVEASTGSLGQGLSVACGIAAGLKIDRKDNRVFCLIGDGESGEGQIWEAAMFAPHFNLDNLTVILDRNRLQIDGCTEDIMCLEPLPPKWRAFNWNVMEIDGHSMREIISALHQAVEYEGKPTIIMSNTIKGRGVSFMEDNLKFHGKAPNDEEYATAMKELEGD